MIRIPVPVTWWAALAAVGAVVGVSSCAPTIKVETPQEPITINLNIKLEADVRLQLEEKARDDIGDNPEIF